MKKGQIYDGLVEKRLSKEKVIEILKELSEQRMGESLW